MEGQGKEGKRRDLDEVAHIFNLITWKLRYKY